MYILSLINSNLDLKSTVGMIIVLALLAVSNSIQTPIELRIAYNDPIRIFQTSHSVSVVEREVLIDGMHNNC